MSAEQVSEIRRLLELDGTLPKRIEVADVTPEGHATPLYAVCFDYEWAQKITCGGFLHVTVAIALSLGHALEIPVEMPELIYDGEELVGALIA